MTCWQENCNLHRQKSWPSWLISPGPICAVMAAIELYTPQRAEMVSGMIYEPLWAGVIMRLEHHFSWWIRALYKSTYYYYYYYYIQYAVCQSAVFHTMWQCTPNARTHNKLGYGFCFPCLDCRGASWDRHFHAKLAPRELDIILN